MPALGQALSNAQCTLYLILTHEINIIFVPNLCLRKLRPREVMGLPKLCVAKTVTVKEILTHEIAYGIY